MKRFTPPESCDRSRAASLSRRLFVISGRRAAARRLVGPSRQASLAAQSLSTAGERRGSGQARRAASAAPTRSHPLPAKQLSGAPQCQPLRGYRSRETAEIQRGREALRPLGPLLCAN
ncbi:hypothetical protein NDU88_007155 [Pleurodeles waltl]|uniref:Uncharacterized protein n=1 Tax=Pleurodeles waltl TaxID=8319 RepID=A0AAV7NX67_PLEWA|nr:hypothetical protein NDU88_007155 [Pleurodeles waltl]